MRALHDDASLRARLVAMGRERAKLFTWRKTARKLLDLCLQVG